MITSEHWQVVGAVLLVIVAGVVAALVGSEWWESRRKWKGVAIAAEPAPGAQSWAHAVAEPEAETCAPAATPNDSDGIEDRRVPRYEDAAAPIVTAAKRKRAQPTRKKPTRKAKGKRK